MKEGSPCQSVPWNEYLSYDATSGQFTWIKKSAKKIVVGSTAGSRDVHGYVRIKLHGVLVLAHRLAWFMYYGHWPDGQIDHKDWCKNNNAIDNLRDVTCSVNQHNRKFVRGAERDRGRWVARITVDYKRIYLGSFATEEEAVEAYNKAKGEYFSG